jgi:hypothetical protein
MDAQRQQGGGRGVDQKFVSVYVLFERQDTQGVFSPAYRVAGPHPNCFVCRYVGNRLANFEIGGKKHVALAAAPSKVAAEGSESTGEQNSSKVENDNDSIEVVDPTEIDKQAATTNGSSKKNTTNDKDDDSDIEVVEVSTPHSAAASNINASASRMPLEKRRLDWDKTNENDDGAKKPKTGDSSASGHGEVEVIEIDSD